MILHTLESPRLTLVSATAALLEADLAGHEKLAELIGARVPNNWPPDLYERSAVKLALALLQDPAQRGWSLWYLLARSSVQAEILGLCGFKGRPDHAGSVEIAYSILRQFRNRGYAAEAVSRLVVWAFSHQNIRQVTAETLPHLRQSIAVLEKNGFTHTGPGSEQGVVRYAVRRPDRN